MQLQAEKKDRLTESMLKLSDVPRLIITPRYLIDCTDGLDVSPKVMGQLRI